MLSFSCPTVKHGEQHLIPTNCAPVRLKARRLYPDKLTSVKSHFKTMLDLGIVHQSNSPTAAHLHVATSAGSMTS